MCSTRAGLVPPKQWLDVRIENLAADRRGQVAAVLKFVELDWSSEFEAGFSRHGFDSGRGQAFRMVWTRTPRASSTAAFVATWRPGATGRAFYR
jgi:hypothetical protein